MPIIGLALGASCRPPVEPPHDAGVAQVVDAGAPKPLPLEVRLTAMHADGGMTEVAFSEDQPRIEPATQLSLSTNLALRNYRVRVFDEVARAMVSDDLAEERPDRLDYRISFPEPLKTGHRYSVVLDAQTGAQMVDSQGNSHPDVRLEFQISGEKEKLSPKKAKRPKKKKKR
ncbi:MAG: hypothetical protein ACOZIN_09690 [Myxococcota bacterium]